MSVSGIRSARRKHAILMLVPAVNCPSETECKGICVRAHPRSPSVLCFLDTGVCALKLHILLFTGESEQTAENPNCCSYQFSVKEWVFRGETAGRNKVLGRGALKCGPGPRKHRAKRVYG